ncbi:MAG TPA: rhodanese-like domain-containing protein [Bryobacteraceae bacterium]|nr:rhodanese-like domain-containing protein [Bryobacteraceae bacterium]
MYFEQFYLSCLAHASYMIGSDGVAAVVDPQRDVDIYVDEARKHDLRIGHVIETHLHADFVSGHHELAARTGAQIYVGASAGAAFPHTSVHDGDQVQFGRCRLGFLETPGHTVESICILVTDLAQSEEPFAVLTGDTLFIGDVGRPDLSPGYTPQQLAGLLYDSLHGKLLGLSDDICIYPAHGAGSLCGRQISSERCSTIGKERFSNYALKAASREEFVHLLTDALPERPGYFQRDAEINRTGAAPLAELPPLQALDAYAVLRLQQNGAVVLDTRPTAQFGAGHIPGSVHIALSGQYAAWAGTIIGLETDLILVAEDAEHLTESRLRLARVGIERIAGYLEGGIETWKRENLALEQVPQLTVQDLDSLLREKKDQIQVLDVRRQGEWEEGHIDGAMLKPLNQLARMMDELDAARPVAVHCKSGYRSSVASSLLRRAGFRQILNVTGGFDAWKSAGLPVALPDPERNYIRNWSRAKVEGYSERTLELHGWPVNLTSYRLGAQFHAKADNVSPGANLARTSAATREEAERLALARAGELLARTQRRAV